VHALEVHEAVLTAAALPLSAAESSMDDAELDFLWKKTESDAWKKAPATVVVTCTSADVCVMAWRTDLSNDSPFV
jgi:hypothetical protein